jgi:tetrapyrrole methylase family protein / MazG family protein
MTLLTIVAPACAALGLDPLEHGLQILHARHLTFAIERGLTAGGSWSEAQGRGPFLPPSLPFPLVATRPALICGLAEVPVAAVRAALVTRYPATHVGQIVIDGQVTATALSELDAEVAAAAVLYLPPLAPLADLRGPDAVPYLMGRLLGPGGCPWDREQTHRSIRRDLLAETHETLEAIDADDAALLAEELGDLLLNIMMHAEIGRQSGEFSANDIYASVAAKLIRRHPHVFGAAAELADGGAVVAQWEQIKAAERAARGLPARGALDGVPPTLPALPTAQELTRKAARAGFGWGSAAEVWEKICEEYAELERAVGGRECEAEYGDLLLAVATLGWRLGIDAESALRGATTTFRRRFTAMEALLAADGQRLNALSAADKLALWSRAKQHNAGGA